MLLQAEWEVLRELLRQMHLLLRSAGQMRERRCDRAG